MAKTDMGVGFPQKYNEPTGERQELNPDATVDLVATPTQPVRAARATTAKPATVPKVTKPRASKKK